MISNFAFFTASIMRTAYFISRPNIFYAQAGIQKWRRPRRLKVWEFKRFFTWTKTWSNFWNLEQCSALKIQLKSATVDFDNFYTAFRHPTSMYTYVCSCLNCNSSTKFCFLRIFNCRLISRFALLHPTFNIYYFQQSKEVQRRPEKRIRSKLVSR